MTRCFFPRAVQSARLHSSVCWTAEISIVVTVNRVSKQLASFVPIRTAAQECCLVCRLGHQHTSCRKVGIETECCADLMTSRSGFTADADVLADRSCKRTCNQTKHVLTSITSGGNKHRHAKSNMHHTVCPTKTIEAWEAASASLKSAGDFNRGSSRYVLSMPCMPRQLTA